MGGSYPYKLKKSDLRYRDHLGKSPEATELTGGETYRQLDKIKKIYNLVWAKEKNIIGMANPVNYEQIFNKVTDHINNKIKIDSDSQLYLNVYGKIKFKPSDDFGDVYTKWVKDKMNFLELREFMREELWAVAKGEWQELAKTYLLDTIGSMTQNLDNNEIKKEIIKGTDIRITRQIGLTLLNQYVKLKELVDICRTLNSKEVNFGIDNLVIISDIDNRQIEYHIKYGYSKVEIIETPATDTGIYLSYIKKTAKYFQQKHNSEVLLKASSNYIWNRMLCGFVSDTSRELPFTNYINKYPQEKSFTKLAGRNYYLAYIDYEQATNMKYYNDKSFKFLNYYLIGKEFCFAEPEIDLRFNKEEATINQTEFLRNNLFPKDFSLKDIMT